ncbi:MAG: proprotein convertase P-domain-containing protein [Flavobacteriales bacterium]|nr:proprotein convertase P-domain-containing protein [Flavobacteriales bacterium]
MNVRHAILFLGTVLSCTALAQTTSSNLGRMRPDGQYEISIDREVPVEFLGTVQPFTSWDSTQVFPNVAVRDRNGILVKRYPPGTKASRLHDHVDPTAQPQGLDPALQTAGPLHGFERAVDLSVDGIVYNGVNPPDPCLSVGPNHVIQMINGPSGAYFRICDKNLATIGAAQTYMDNFLAAQLSYSGLGDPVVVYDALADRWLISEFTSNNNNLIVAISQTPNPTGAWYVYSYTATNFPDYPKYGVWNNCYVVTSNENSPAIYALPRANMLAGTAGTAVRFTVSSYGTIGFQACTPVHFGGGDAPPAGAPAMFMRMADDAWTTSTTDVDRLELWNINYNAGTPASSTITGPTALNTEAFDTGLCGYTSFACMNQPGSATTLDPLREVLMNRISYRNLTATQGYEGIACSHVTDVSFGSDRGGVRWYELHRTGGSANPWSIYQQGTWSPDANDRWMSGIALNQNGDIGLSYNISGTTGGNVYPGIRYTGRYRTDPLGQMTFAETSIVAGAASNSSNRYGDYASLDVDPADGTSFYGTAQYNPAAAWSTRMFKFSFPANTGCTYPVATATPACANLSQYNVGVNLTNMGSATSIDIQVDNDAGGSNGYTTVQTVTVTGSYGPFGPYATGSAVNVRLLNNLDANCNLNLNNVVAVCNGPGSQCAYSSTGTTNIADNTTVTNSIVVPSLGGATITDLNVFVNLTHTYTADLRLSLQSPTGTIINMIASGLCTDNDNIIVEFDQQAANLIGAVCPMNNIFARPSSSFAGFNSEVMQGNWTLRVQDAATGDVGTINSWCLIPTLSSPNVLVSPKVFLEGPYDIGTGLMGDGLRSASLIPTTQPFTTLGYAFTGAPGAGGTVVGSVFTTTGNNAIVDWVIVELRNPASPASVLVSCAALVQRDGDVVALNGTSPVSLTIGAGSYHVTVRHRNHLGAMTNAAVALSAATTTVDLTSAATATFGTDARKTVGSIQALWTGDVSFNKTLAYVGVGNDRDPILTRVGGTTPNNVVSGYFSEDTNLDGSVRYIGVGNDRDVILVNVGSTTPNNTRTEQVP